MECAKCVSCQTVASANPAKIWSSLEGLGKRNNAVKKGGVYAIMKDLAYIFPYYNLHAN